MPRPTQKPRPATPRVAARTMPTIRPASMTSRKTMTRGASIAVPQTRRRLLCNHLAKGRVGMELALEGIGAGGKWAQVDRALLAAGDDLLDLEGGGIEFLGRSVLVLDHEEDGLAGRHMQL